MVHGLSSIALVTKGMILNGEMAGILIWAMKHAIAAVWK
jgi:hypothetical protein